MNYPISHKLVAVVVAVLMNGMVLGSVDYLFAAPATTSQLLRPAPGMMNVERGIA